MQWSWGQRCINCAGGVSLWRIHWATWAHSRTGWVFIPTPQWLQTRTLIAFPHVLLPVPLKYHLTDELPARWTQMGFSCWGGASQSCILRSLKWFSHAKMHPMWQASNPAQPRACQGLWQTINWEISNKKQDFKCWPNTEQSHVLYRGEHEPWNLTAFL